MRESYEGKLKAENSDEGKYLEHEGVIDKIEEADTQLSDLEKAGRVAKLIAAITQKRKKIEQGKEASQATKEDTLEAAKRYIEGMRERAEEYARVYGEAYMEEHKRIAKELGHQAEIARISDFIEETKRLKVEDGVSLEDKARLIAAMDVFKPKMNMPGYAGNTITVGENEIGIRNGTRFVASELGQADMDIAAKAAQEKEWQNIIKASTFVTVPGGESDEPFEQGRIDNYIAVDDRTAALLRAAGPENLNSSSAIRGDWGMGRIEGTLHENFEVIEPVKSKVEA